MPGWLRLAAHQEVVPCLQGLSPIFAGARLGGHPVANANLGSPARTTPGERFRSVVRDHVFKRLTLQNLQEVVSRRRLALVDEGEPDRPAIALVLVGVGSSWIAIVIVVVLLLGVLIARPQIQNTSAGLVLTVRPSFGVGDQIQVMDTRGTVLQIGSHSTVLESVDGVRSYIPNTSMLGEMVHVYSATDARRAEFDMSLAAGTDIAKALGIISNTLTTTQGVLSDPASEVLASRLDQDAMIVTARIWYSSKLKTDIEPVSAAILAVRNALGEADIELGGATTGLDITNESAAPDEPSPT